MNTAEVSAWFTTWRQPVQTWLQRYQRGVRTVDLDDIAQETFMRLLRYPTDKVVANPEAYLCRVASNVAYEWADRARNRRPHIPLHLLVDDLNVADDNGREDMALALLVTQTPETITDAAMLNRVIHDTITAMPARRRNILLLHMNDLTYKEIASQLQVTPRLVLREIRHAYAALRARLT